MNIHIKEIQSASVLIKQPESTKKKLLELEGLVKDEITSKHLEQLIQYGVIVHPRTERIVPSVTAKNRHQRNALKLLLSGYGVTIKQHRFGASLAAKNRLDNTFLYYSVEEMK